MSRPARLALAAVFALGAAGCSGPPRRTEDPDTTNLRRIYVAISAAQGYTGRAPKNQDELIKCLAGIGEEGNPEEFAVSRRDGKPFVVFHGHMIDRDLGDTIMAYEQDGADGKRFVLTASGTIKSLTDEEFAKAKFLGKKPTKPAG